MVRPRIKQITLVQLLTHFFGGVLLGEFVDAL